MTKEIEYKAEPRGVEKMKVPEAYKSDPLVHRALPFLASWRVSNNDEFTKLVKSQHVATTSGIETGSQFSETYTPGEAIQEARIESNKARKAGRIRSEGKAREQAELSELQNHMQEKQQALRAAMKNTPREYQVGKTEKQRRSQKKALRDFVKKKEEQHRGLTPEVRYMNSRDQAEQQRRGDAQRLRALEGAFRGPARQMAKKLSA